MMNAWMRALNGGRQAVLLALLALTALMILPAYADITAGKEYQLLSPPQPVTTGDKIEVIEFFYYGCPYCNEALPRISKWLPTLPADVQYRRVPVVRPDKWAPLARTYYTLETLGKLDLHRHMFDSMHVDGLSLSDEKEMADWAQRNYIDRAKFMEIYHSADTEAKVKKAQEMTEAYNISRIPAFAVDGKYLTTSGLAGSLDAMLPTVDKLIAKARAERAKK
jgi:thiol:disulfide interchange protein DsbA